MKTRARKLWWERRDLHYQSGALLMGAHDLRALAGRLGTPLYGYHAPRIRANLGRLRESLKGAGLSSRVFYAMKSNRSEPVLRFLRSAGGCGVDVCSPNELTLALACGFLEGEISFTGTSLSEADALCLADHPGVHVNCDSLASLRRVARLSTGRPVGIRINPGVGLGYRANGRLRYAGQATTKFGIYREQFDEALELCAHLGLRLVGLHCHAGCGFLTPQLPDLDRVLRAARGFISRVPGLRYVNIGGGLGIPLVEGDRPLDLGAWAQLLARHFSRDPFEVWIEPGDYIVKDAGALLLEVNTVERKRDTLFVGVNGGFNLHVEPVFYGLPLVAAPCVPGGAPRRRVTVAGNINEALDLLAQGVVIALPKEGDILALLNAGGYGASMSSNHCMRGDFQEVLLP